MKRERTPRRRRSPSVLLLLLLLSKLLMGLSIRVSGGVGVRVRLRARTCFACLVPRQWGCALGRPRAAPLSAEARIPGWRLIPQAVDLGTVRGNRRLCDGYPGRPEGRGELRNSQLPQQSRL